MVDRRFRQRAPKGDALLAEVGHRGRSRGVDDTGVWETANSRSRIGSKPLAGLKTPPGFPSLAGPPRCSDGLSDG